MTERENATSTVGRVEMRGCTLAVRARKAAAADSLVSSGRSFAGLPSEARLGLRSCEPIQSTQAQYIVTQAARFLGFRCPRQGFCYFGAGFRRVIYTMWNSRRPPTQQAGRGV